MVGLPQRLSEELDGYVEQTRADRDRFVDLLRVVSIGVVVVWHWALSITQWRDGALVMPNPIDVVPGGWLATWVLQIMPMFFLVGGSANHAGWSSVQRDGGGARQFLGSRLRRLLVPTGTFVAAWTLFDGLMLVVWPGYRSVLEWGTIVITPFWFLVAYLWVLLLVPVTIRLHQTGGVLTLTVLGAIIALVDVGRFHLGVAWLGLVNRALVFLLIHQLGYFARDGTYDRIGWRGQLAIVFGALAAMIVLTSLPVYPRSMVATRDIDFSHLWPTTAVVAVMTMLQTGVAMLLRPALRGWLQRRRVWKSVIGINAVILTVFLWHMTAKILVIAGYEALDLPRLEEPTRQW